MILITRKRDDKRKASSSHLGLIFQLFRWWYELKRNLPSSKYRMDHRIPPKPTSYDSAPKGTCRWCNTPILGKTGKPNVRASWHPKCVNEYKLIHWPGVTRRAVFKRDRGVCASCGHQCARKGKDVWHMDHIKPLIESLGDLKFWKLPNLQTLCQRCHFAKTGREATARAEARRQGKQS